MLIDLSILQTAAEHDQAEKKIGSLEKENDSCKLRYVDVKTSLTYFIVIQHKLKQLNSYEVRNLDKKQICCRRKQNLSKLSTHVTNDIEKLGENEIANKVNFLAEKRYWQR